MSYLFENVNLPAPQKSAFDLTHSRKFSFNVGELAPALFMEIVPGDQIKCRSNLLVRMLPMVSPALVELDVYMHYFFVPNRIIWEDWKEFITGGDPDTADPTIPYEVLASTETVNGRIHDYFNIQTAPAGVGSNIKVQNLPYRAYQKIWDDYYRDQNLQAETDIETWTTFQAIHYLLKRNYAKDYFTSAFTEPQKGDPVSVDGTVTYLSTSKVYNSSGSLTDQIGSVDHNASGNLTVNPSSGNQTGRVENIDTINIDIVELRRAEAMQRFLEKDMLGGNRYIEHLKVHYGVHNDDLSLQRPQYLGGGKQPIIISEVLDTSSNTGALGNMAGHGISVGNVNNFVQTFKEHGYLFGLCSIMPKVAYKEGVHRNMFRWNRFDFYFPEFANIGEQEIYDAEVFVHSATGSLDPDDITLGTGHWSTWGYQQRFAEYKYICDSVHGEFRDPAKLGSWVFARNASFLGAGVPPLDEYYVECWDDDFNDQVFASATGDHFFVHCENVIHARRPMPYFANYKLG
jgi:hypothetical protein